MTGARGLRGGHWLLIGLVAVIVAAGIGVVVSRGDGGPTAAEPTPAPAPSSSVSARADCVPEIVERGTVGGAGPRYGFVYRNRCDRVVRLLQFRVTAQDASGQPINEVPQDTENGGVLLPGTELAVAGAMQAPSGVTVAGIGVEVIRYQDFPASDFSAWARTTVTGLRKGTPDRAGSYEVTGTQQVDPVSTPVCVTAYVLIMRNGAGRMVWADEKIATPTAPAELSFEVPAPAGANLARSTIYAPQLPSAAQPVPGTACTGAQ